MASLAELLDYDQRKKQMLSALQAGTDVINRGTIAGTLGTPVDLANTALQAIGLGSEKPVLGSEWIGEKMQQAGMVSPERRPVAEFAAGFVNPETVATKGVMLAKALASKTAPLHAMMVFHGTPHKFEPTANNPLGEFTASKIGSGEGAAAFGHGIYVAENPAVAKDYQNRLADYGSPYTYKWQGKDYVQGTQGDPVTHAIGLTYHQNSATAKKIARQGIADAKAGEPYALEMGGIDYYQKMLDTANNLKKSDIKVTQGSLYTADLPDEHIEKMLDLDKPWEKQSQYVKDRLKDSGIYAKYKDNLSDFRSPMETRNKTMRGENIHAFIQHLANNDPAQASQMLKDMGIPGLKYLDEKSRSSGKGTRNFVVFPGEEQNLKILKRE